MIFTLLGIIMGAIALSFIITVFWLLMTPILVLIGKMFDHPWITLAGFLLLLVIVWVISFF